MHELFAFLMKLLTIFIGSGMVSVIAFFLARELSKLPQLVLNKYKTPKNNRLKLLKQKQFDSSSAFYMLSYNRNKNIKLFSTPNGIKMI